VCVGVSIGGYEGMRVTGKTQCVRDARKNIRIILS
jgi:hypothetical protein